MNVSLVTLIILLAGCYAFELFSLITGKGHYELWDVAAGMAGALIGVAIALIVIIAGII